MNLTLRILVSQLKTVARSRWVIGYGVLLLCGTALLLRFGGSGDGPLSNVADLPTLHIAALLGINHHASGNGGLSW